MHGKERGCEILYIHTGFCAIHMFSPGWRPRRGANGIRRRPREGLGPGLHIVHEILDVHGGEVRVESDEAHGTTFSIESPRKAAPPGRNK
ncbi:MAG TPA: ATP-binding protein [Paraburkholderia sp.]|nr:ATP-binding protein [Paraburkholderia sp.]